jgi:hypothetical protein
MVFASTFGQKDEYSKILFFLKTAPTGVEGLDSTD